MAKKKEKQKTKRNNFFWMPNSRILNRQNIYFFFLCSLSKYHLISIIRLIINILRKIYINEQNCPQF
jgi:hypothetical protein